MQRPIRRAQVQIRCTLCVSGLQIVVYAPVSRQRVDEAHLPAGMTAAEMGVVCLKAPREVTNDSVTFDKEEIEVCLSEQCGVVQLDHLATYVCLTRPDPSPVADRELVCLYCIEDCKTQKIILPVTYSLPTCRKVSDQTACV